MNGFFQFCRECLQARGQRPGLGRSICGRGASPGSSRIFLTLPLSLLLAAFGALGWAQHDPMQHGMEDAAVPERPRAERKTIDVIPPPQGMSYTTRTNHTALWVGDQFHYMIFVEYTPQFEFVLDNLTKETVNMDPLQVMEVSKNTAALKNNNKRLIIDLTLANFSSGQNSLQIPQFTLYYFRKESRTRVEQAVAESLTIPGPVLGLRSTLPPQPADIRDAITVNSWARSRWILPIAAMGCAVILAIGLAWEATMLVKRRRARKGPDPRKAMEAVRARWASSVPGDFSDAKTTMEFLGSSYQHVKEYVGHYLETSAMGLTAEELQEEMQRLGANPDFTRKVVKVLDTCESLRYSPNGAEGYGDIARAVAQDVREILNSKR